MNSLDVLYRLDTTVPIHEAFKGRLIGMAAIIFGMMFVPSPIKIFMLIAIASMAVPMVREYVRKQLKGLLLTGDYLEVKLGSKGRVERIALSEIQRVEVVEKYNKRNAHRKKFRQKRGETTVVLIDEKKNVSDYQPNTKCIIRTTNGKKYEIRSDYFEEGEFGVFLEQLQSAYNAKQTLSPAKPVMSKSIAPAQEEDKISQVMRTNFSYLQEDLQMKKAIETNMIEAYKSVYKIRDSFDMSKMVNVTTIYEFRNPDNSTSFVLEDDFLPELDEESIEIGKNLIDAAQKNLSLVETRIAYYKRIDRELEKIRFQEANRRKLQGVAENLKNLQEKNTNRSIDQSLTGANIDIDNRVVNQLEELTQKVHNMEDLENSILLKEHISLFKNE